MEKILIFIISFPLLAAFWMSETSDTLSINTFSNTDTIPTKSNASAENICLNCHSKVVAKKNKHKPIENNRCVDCHNTEIIDHSEAKTGTLKEVPELCFSCHAESKELISSSPFVHKAVQSKKSCVNCHSPHSSDNKKLLLASRKELCLSCHNKSTKADKTPAINFEKLMASKTLHPPFEGCEKTCHNPHAGSGRLMFNTPFAVGDFTKASTDSFALCWECHGSDMIEKPKSKGATSFRNGEDNLHWLHVSGEKGKSCLMCHSPHATDNLHLIRTTVKFGTWNFNMNYKATETGGSCLPSCHVEKTYTR
jgi:predicted CXXCH cytochrome family protein